MDLNFHLTQPFRVGWGVGGDKSVIDAGNKGGNISVSTPPGGLA